MSRYKNGLFAEYYAALFLFLKGYRVLVMRYKTKVGEVDIIARRKNTIVFIEVKYRKDRLIGGDAISPKSQSRIRRAAEYYMMKNQNESNIIDCELRMDAMIVTHKLFIHHIKNAF